MNITARILAAAALSACLTVPAVAGDIRWTLSNVTFDDGGTASGWFEYDSGADRVLGWSIQTSGGDARGGFDYETNDDPAVQGPGDFLFAGNDQANPYLRLIVDGTFPGNGGAVALLTGPDGGYECGNCDGVRFVNHGSLVGVAVAPEPTSWAMMVGGFGVIGAGLRARRKTQLVFA